MAGLLYLPRLFVYHAGALTGSEMAETFKTMEQRLLRIIMNPAMIVAWIFGLLMLAAKWDFLMSQGWMHLKLTTVILLTVLHMVYAKWRKRFAADNNKREARFYRIWNEVPALLMVIAVIAVVVEPF
jgi:putative membrane protein